MRTKIRRAVERVAADEGALRVEWLTGNRHYIVRFYMPDGSVPTMPISKRSAEDEFKMRGWVRQYIRNPARQHSKT